MKKKSSKRRSLEDKRKIAELMDQGHMRHSAENIVYSERKKQQKATLNNFLNEL